MDCRIDKRDKKTQMSACITSVLLYLMLAFPNVVWGWGGHQPITEAALRVLPEQHQQLKEQAGRSNFRDSMQWNWDVMREYSMLPDHDITDFAGYTAPDYIHMRALPDQPGHLIPQVLTAVEPHFKRGMQALKTETLTEAFRRLGPIMHYVQDIGAPPHAMPTHGPAHRLMETWDRTGVIDITGYEPRMLGENAEEALKGLYERLEHLVEYSKARAEQILPLVKAHGEEGREKYQHIVLESAHETARVTADLLHTMFTLGLSPEHSGARLTGKIEFEKNVRYHDTNKGTRIMLLDDSLYSDVYRTVGENERIYRSATEYTTFTDADGTYELRNLPDGTYRVLAYRLGSEIKLSDAVNLVTDEKAVIDLRLQTAEPLGNLLYNPQGRYFDIWEDMPDRWRKTPYGWRQQIAISGGYVSYLRRNTSQIRFNVGAVLKDRDARIRLIFTGYDARDPWMELELQNGTTHPEQIFSFPWAEPHRHFLQIGAEEKRLSRMIIDVITEKEFSDAVENIYVIPVYVEEDQE